MDTPLVFKSRPYLDVGCGIIAPSGLPAASGCAAASAFLARSSGLDALHQVAYINLICGLVADGVWIFLDAVYVLATTNTTTALLNLVSTSFPLTVNGAPTFTADSGYVGGAGKWLDTGFNPSSATNPNYTRMSACAFLWTLDTLASGNDYGAAFGYAADASHDHVNIYPHFSDNNYYWAANNNAIVSNTAFTAGTHFIGWTRADNSTTLGWQTTTSASFSVSTDVLLNSNFIVLSDTNNGSKRPFSANVAFACFGANLTVGQQTSLYNRVHTYMQKIAGAP